MCVESVKSEEATLIESSNDQLDLISPYFKVDETKYGGRGCFAYSLIPKDTVIASCSNPLSSTILREFKKEVCSLCFQYFEGKTLKFKLGKENVGSQFSLYFCTQQCLEEFQEHDIDEIYLESLLRVEEWFNKGLKKPEVELKEPSKEKSLIEHIKNEWSSVKEWEGSLERMKISKRQNMIPRISDSEYTEVKYIIGILFQYYKYQQTQSSEQKFLKDCDFDERNQFELDSFEALQSNELDKVNRYPYLVYSYVNIYKFLKLTTHPLLQTFINTDSIRNIIGRQLSNAFGVWSNVIDESREDKEFFGYAVYPTASFFNHSCDPNIIKKRIGNKLTFTTLRDINPKEELCINYGYSTEERVEVRRKDLKEWFFDCACTRCISELNQL